jgi:hypothetical protein
MEVSLDKFPNKKNVDHQATHLKVEIETIQLKVMSTYETNTMTEQAWVVNKAMLHKTSLSFGPRPYEP